MSPLSTTSPASNPTPVRAAMPPAAAAAPRKDGDGDADGSMGAAVKLASSGPGSTFHAVA